MAHVARSSWPTQARAWPGRLTRSEGGDLWFPPHPTSDAFRASRVRGPAAHAQPAERLATRGPREVRFSGSFLGGLGVNPGCSARRRELQISPVSTAGPPPQWEPELPISSSPPRSAFANCAEGITRLLGAAEPLRKCFCLCSAARFPMLLGTGSQLSCLLVCLY